MRRLFAACRGLQHAAAAAAAPAPGWLHPKCEFKPEKVAVVTKTTRYEFEQQRYRYAGLSEEDLKQLVGPCVLGGAFPETERLCAFSSWR